MDHDSFWDINLSGQLLSEKLIIYFPALVQAEFRASGFLVYAVNPQSLWASLRRIRESFLLEQTFKIIESHC